MSKKLTFALSLGLVLTSFTNLAFACGGGGGGCGGGSRAYGFVGAPRVAAAKALARRDKPTTSAQQPTMVAQSRAGSLPPVKLAKAPKRVATAPAASVPKPSRSAYRSFSY